MKKIKNGFRAEIMTIPHNKQRYPTAGDWMFSKKGNLLIQISHMQNWKYEFLVGLHELIESVLCKDRGINQKEVDEFDIEFEKNRKEGNQDEPGDDFKAPYHNEHQVATFIEKMMADELGVSWKEYDKTVNEL